MPVNIEKCYAEIGSFNGCLLYSIVKLHLNLLNLLFHMFLVFICIIKLTVCYITKFQVFFISLHFSYMPVPLFFQSLSPISQFLRAPFSKRLFTIYLYISTFADVNTALLSYISFCSNTEI